VYGLAVLISSQIDLQIYWLAAENPARGRRGGNKYLCGFAMLAQWALLINSQSKPTLGQE
jgi:hypothetical protein